MHNAARNAKGNGLVKEMKYRSIGCIDAILCWNPHHIDTSSCKTAKRADRLKCSSEMEANLSGKTRLVRLETINREAHPVFSIMTIPADNSDFCHEVLFSG
jgi:hypothetical protein